MAAITVQPLAAPLQGTSAPAITVCHFTLSHKQLKSRSFHRQFLPLASLGVSTRYLSPASPPRSYPGIEFISLPTIDRFLQRAFAYPSLLKTLLLQNSDLYHFQDPDLLPLGFALKLLFRKRVVYDAYEDFPSAVSHKKSIPRALRPVAARTLSIIENLAARCLDGIITADPITLHRFAGRTESRKISFYNFPNLDFFPAPSPAAKMFDLVYRGGLSERTGSFVLLDALRLLSRRPQPVRTLLIGYFDDAVAERSFRQRISELGLESNIEIRGRLDHELMADALAQARIGVCPLLPVPKFLSNIPVKVFEYWACAMPVVATDLPPIRAFLRNLQAGILIPPGNSRALASAIANLLDNPERASFMGQQGRQLIAQKLNNSIEVAKLRRFMLHIARTPESRSAKRLPDLATERRMRACSNPS